MISLSSVNVRVRAQLDALRAVNPRQRERLFIEWLGIFALGISQFITNKLAALIFFIACCCLLFGKVTFREAASVRRSFSDP